MDEKSCGVVIFLKEGTLVFYLLLHYPTGHWDFAKGHQESQETDEQTARREAAEETGISDLAFIPGFQARIHYAYQRNGVRMSKDVIFFLAKTTTKNVMLSHEHQNFAWLSYADAYQRLTFKNARSVLEAAEKRRAML